MSVIRAIVKGCGSYLPENIVTNHDLAEKIDTTHEWIVGRTGIEARHIASEGELTSDLALAAAKNALKDASMAAEEIDLIVLATSTPDNTFPSTATKIQAKLGIFHGAAFDVQAVCSGFVYALSVAEGLLKSGQHKKALVIGAETFSRILDWEDRTTCVLFGDGAGAVVLEACEGEGTLKDRGILAAQLRSDGRYYDKLYVDGGPSSNQVAGFLRMEGREVFRHAVGNISSIISSTLEEVGLEPSDIDWFVPHQANKRILEGTARKIGMDMDKIVITVDRHGNTSAASIPLALDLACKDGRIQKGDLVLLEAMGGGFTWGAVLIRW